MPHNSYPRCELNLPSHLSRGFHSLTHINSATLTSEINKFALIYAEEALAHLNTKEELAHEMAAK